MAANLTRLNVSLALLTGPFSKAMDGVGRDVAKFGKRLEGAILGPIGAITGALSAGALVAGIKQASDRIDGLAKSADKLGISTQSLAGLRLAADESGSSAADLESAMGKLQVRIQQASTGNKEAAKSFQDLGIPLSQIAGLRADEQFGKVADAINNLGTKSAQSAAMVDIFGKSGMDLSATLANGSAGLQQATKDAEAMGLAVSRVDAFKIEEANDAFGRIGKVIEGVFNTLTIKLAPFITAFATAFTDASVETKGFGDVFDKVINAAIVTLGFFADAWQGVSLAFQASRYGIAKVGEALFAAGNDGVSVGQLIADSF
jgi:hypothetical protein